MHQNRLDDDKGAGVLHILYLVVIKQIIEVFV